MTAVVGAAIAVDVDYVYWLYRTPLKTRTLMRVAIDGGGLVAMVSDPVGVADQIAVDSTNIYWTSSDADGSVKQMSKCCIPVPSGDQ